MNNDEEEIKYDETAYELIPEEVPVAEAPRVTSEEEEHLQKLVENLERAKAKIEHTLKEERMKIQKKTHGLASKLTPNSVILEDMDTYYPAQMSQRTLFYSGGHTGLRQTEGGGKHEVAARLLQSTERPYESIIVAVPDEEKWGVGEAFNYIEVTQYKQHHKEPPHVFRMVVRISNSQVYDHVEHRVHTLTSTQGSTPY